MTKSVVAIHTGFGTFALSGYLGKIGPTMVGVVKRNNRWIAFRQPDGSQLSDSGGYPTRAQALKVARQSLKQIEVLKRAC